MQIYSGISEKVKKIWTYSQKQRAYTNKEEASSPTVAIKSVLLSCVIDAMEGRDVATIDIPRAFMQADMEDVVHMKLEGKVAELLVRIDPKLYRKHVQIQGGKQVLYVELKKALYGTLKAASAVILEETYNKIETMGILRESIQLVCNEQDN
jgi:hypothetical protein